MLGKGRKNAYDSRQWGSPVGPSVSHATPQGHPTAVAVSHCSNLAPTQREVQRWSQSPSSNQDPVWAPRLAVGSGPQLHHSSHLSVSVITVATCQELLDKALETLWLTLVIDEDGTSVDCEDFFQLLEEDTCLMMLEFKQSWSPSRSRCYHMA